MKLLLLALTVFVMLVFCSARTGETQVKAQADRVDAFGDALPPGALFRLGSTRWHHLGEITDLRFSEDGRSITTVGSDSGLAVTFDIASGKETRRVKLKPGELMLFPRFSTNGERILANAAEHLLLFSATNGKLLLRIEGEIDKAQMSPDGKRLMHFDDDGDLRHVDAATGRLIKTVRLSSALKFENWSPTIPPDGKWVSAFDRKGKKGLEIWDADSGKQVHLLNKGGNFSMAAPAFSPDGRFVAAADSSHFRDPGLPVIIWDLVTGKEVRRLRVEYPKSVKGNSIGSDEQFLRFSADGNLLAYLEGYMDSQTIWVWDVKTGKVRQQLKANGRLGESGFFTPAAHLAFCRDGTMLAAAGKSGAVLIWNLTTGKLVRPKQPEVFERTIRYVEHGKRIVVGYRSPEKFTPGAATEVWEVGTGRQVLTFPGKALADVSATGNLLALYDPASPDSPNNKDAPRRAEIVDLASGKTRWYSTKLGSDLRFSPDGKKLVSFRKGVKILDPRNGKELSHLKLETWQAISRSALRRPCRLPEGQTRLAGFGQRPTTLAKQ